MQVGRLRRLHSQQMCSGSSSSSSSSRGVVVTAALAPATACPRNDAAAPAPGAQLQQRQWQRPRECSVIVKKGSAATARGPPAPPRRASWLLRGLLLFLRACTPAGQQVPSKCTGTTSTCVHQLAPARVYVCRFCYCSPVQIATASQLEPPTRSLAAECLVTLCEARDKAPGMVRRLPNFVGGLFDALMHFLLDIEDEPDWHRVSRGSSVSVLPRVECACVVECTLTTVHGAAALPAGHCGRA
jgi:hypothetical protein